MVKVILFDIYGLLICPPHFYSAELEKQGYKDVEKSLKTFYQGPENLNCLEGKAGIENAITPYLKKFGWQKSAVEYLDEMFEFESKFLDIEFLDQIQKLRKKGIKCCLCADKVKYRAKLLLNNLNFQNMFDHHYLSCYIGYRKCHKQFWDIILEDINNNYPDIKREEIVFFDDSQSNVDMASKSGIQVFLFTDTAQFSEDISKSTTRRQT